jgi:TfuA protein
VTPSTRVFLGPTLSHDEARSVLDVEYSPPVTDRDLDQAVAAGIEVIGIIDAAFIQTYSATPTQILRHLRGGIVIFGAASAGALRAVEADSFGMRGIGGIYRLFRSGFDAEDELAVAFDPETLRPLSEAMVNVRYALGRALRSGVLSQSAHDVLIQIAKDIYFPERTYRSVLEQAAGTIPGGELEALAAFLDANRIALDWKRADAIECLETMKRYLDSCRRRSLARAG